MNAWTGADAESVQCLQAPAIVHYKDRGVAPSFVLEWKFMNDKLYGMTLATAVKTSGTDPDKAEKWLTAADVRAVRLALMESVQPVENRDGIPLKKNLDLWLSNHGGERRKALSLKSLAAHHQWCSHCNFVEIFALLSKVVQAAFETSVKEGTRQVSQIEAAIAKGLPPLLRM